MKPRYVSPFGLRMGAMIVAALQEDWRQVSEIAKSTKLAMVNGEPIPAEFKELLDSLTKEDPQ